MKDLTPMYYAMYYEPDGHQWEMLTVSYARQPK